VPTSITCNEPEIVLAVVAWCVGAFSTRPGCANSELRLAGAETAVIVSSKNRPQVLLKRNLSIRRQTISPMSISLVVVDTCSCIAGDSASSRGQRSSGPTGLTRRTPVWSASLPPPPKLIPACFWMNDTELAPHYLGSMSVFLFDGRGRVWRRRAASSRWMPRIARPLSRAEAYGADRWQRFEG